MTCALWDVETGLWFLRFRTWQIAENLKFTGIRCCVTYHIRFNFKKSILGILVFFCYESTMAPVVSNVWDVGVNFLVPKRRAWWCRPCHVQRHLLTAGVMSMKLHHPHIMPLFGEVFWELKKHSPWSRQRKANRRKAMPPSTMTCLKPNVEYLMTQCHSFVIWRWYF